MSSYEHKRYDVEAWVNAHDEIEIKVYDHSRNTVIGHLVEADEQPDTIEKDDGFFYASVWAEDKPNWTDNKTTVDISLYKFEQIERDAPEHSENTLYWSLSGDSFDWYRHPLYAWESSLAAGDGIMAFEAQGNTDEWLTNHFNQLAKQYMNNVKSEFHPER
jgi:hypothetical protein